MGNMFEVSLSVSENGKKKPQYTLESDINGQMTLGDLLQHTKDILIVTSYEVLKEEQSKGFEKDPIVLVDNRSGKSPAHVHPLGQIEFIAKVDFDKMLIDAFIMLLKRSKVLTGRYLYSHVVVHRGVQVASDLGTLRSWLASNPDVKDGEEIMIINVQPYARKLETAGITAQRSNPKERPSRRRNASPDIKIKVPNGAYALSARAIKRQYGKNAGIRFTYLSGGMLGLSGTFKNAGRKGRNSKGRPYLYPAIIFKISTRGLNV